ncbi:MAG: hypothetical protein OHK0038_03430 [Flammeovirgaceae bacterium]
MFKKIQHKLLYYFLIVGVLPLTLTIYAEYKSMTRTLREKSFEHLTSIRESRKKSIEQFFLQAYNNIEFFSQTSLIAFKEFQNTFLSIPQVNLSREKNIALKQYYAKKLIPNINASSDSIQKALKSYFPDDARSHQIQANFWLEKENITHPSFLKYQEILRKHQDMLLKFNEVYGYHNLLLVDNKTGYVVFEAHHEIDFGISLFHKTYAQQEIGRLFKRIREMSIENAKILLSDFVQYMPNRNQPTAFIAAPIFDRSENIGSVIVQISTLPINEIMTNSGKWETDGLGKTGESYLVGSDFKMRSDSRFYIENPQTFIDNAIKRKKVADYENIKKHQTTVLFYEINTEDVKSALSGKAETRLIEDDYQQEAALTSYTPLYIEGINWVLIAEIEANEAFLPIKQLSKRFIYMIGAALISVITVAVLISRSFSQPLLALYQGTEKIRSGNLNVQLPVKSKDEIGQLTAAFNETVKTIKEKNDAILQSNKLLQQKNQEIEQQKAEIDRKHEKLILYAQEISEANKKLEDARQEQQKFVAMAENSSDLITMYDFNGKLLYINPAGRLMLGIKQEQPIQHITIADIAKLNKSSTLIDRVLSEVKRQGFMKQEMLIYHTVSGNAIQVEALTFVITDDSKFLCLASMMRDIRDRKKSEKELKEYSERLAAINKEMEKKQIQNKLQSEELQKSHEELLKKNQDLAHQRDSIAAKNREITLTIDQLNQTIKRLKETQTQLVEAEKMASIGQLTAGIAHEINNPINFISGNIEPLRLNISDLKNLINEINKVKSIDDLEKVKKLENDIQLDVLLKELDSLLEGIEEGARRTKEIVLGLRNFSRLDEHDLKKANINEGIHSTIVLLKNKLRASNIELQENYDKLPSIACYPGKLNQVFMNIISNAIHAVEKAKREDKGKICITTKNLDKEISICIEDNGVGMSKKVIKRIFEPFFTTKEVGDGTGLGLSITHGIIQQHHGQIKVESEEGKGAAFTILIPKNLEELIEKNQN